MRRILLPVDERRLAERAVVLRVRRRVALRGWQRGVRRSSYEQVSFFREQPGFRFLLQRLNAFVRVRRAEVRAGML